jgi:hypothetical protein
MRLRGKAESLENPLSSGILIDTSILVEYSKRRHIEKLVGSNISVITLLEFLRYFKDERKRRELKELLEALFNVVDMDNDVLLTYCDLYNKLKERGEMIDDADLIIASSAIAKDLILWTGNFKHFERLEKFGLKLKRD